MKKKFFFIFILNFLFTKIVFGDLVIQEIFPNTIKDSEFEYFILKNQSDNLLNIDGYYLTDNSGKKYFFHEYIFDINEEKKYIRPDTKIILNNSDEELYLKNSSGAIIDSWFYTNTQKGVIYTRYGENQEVEYLSTQDNVDEIIEDNIEATIDEDIVNGKSRNHIPPLKIEVQSGLEKQHSRVYKHYYVCNKKDCKINLKYNNLLENRFNCKWKFYKGVHLDGTEKKCNPGYVTFGPGLHKVKLIVYDKYYKNNKKILTFYVDNIYKAEELKSRISLQGVLGKNKIKIGDSIFCINSEDCSLNFSGEKSTGDIINYEWDFGSGVIIKGKNPLSYKFGLGENIVSLKIYDSDGNQDKQDFIVHVLKDELTEEEIKEIIFKNRTILSLKRNELLFEDFLNNFYLLYNENKKEQILDNFTQKFRKNKKSVTIYGKTEKNCTILIENNEKGFFGTYKTNRFFLETDENGKYSLNIKNNNLGVFETKTYIFDEKLGKIDSKVSKKYKIDTIDSIFEQKSDKLITYIDQEKEIKKSLKNIDKQTKTNKVKEKIDITIDLQGKIGSNKIISSDAITCIKTCSINFDASNSKGNIVKYIWDFGNGETFEGINPPYIKYNDYGTYILKLKAIDGFGETYIKTFTIIYIEKLLSDKKNNINNNKEIIKKQLEKSEKIDNLGGENNNFNISLLSFIVLLSSVLCSILLKKEKII